MEQQISQLYRDYVNGINGTTSAPTNNQALHEMARGMTKHLTMHEGWTTESQNASTPPEGWTLPTRVTMWNGQASQQDQLDPTKVSEVLVTVPWIGDPVTAAQTAVTAAVLKTNATEAQYAQAVGAGAWAGPDPNTLIVSILYQR